jgi:hypothetical protein
MGHPAVDCPARFDLALTSSVRCSVIEPLSMPQSASDAALATSLATKLWPHREHESNAVKGLCCRFGLHRWRQLDLRELVPGREVHFCFWCSKVRIDGIVYDP